MNDIKKFQGNWYIILGKLLLNIVIWYVFFIFVGFVVIDFILSKTDSKSAYNAIENIQIILVLFGSPVVTLIRFLRSYISLVTETGRITVKRIFKESIAIYTEGYKFFVTNTGSTYMGVFFSSGYILSCVKTGSKQFEIHLKYMSKKRMRELADYLNSL